jgi:hypothetical protein
MQSLPWIVALVASALLTAMLTAWAVRRRKPKGPAPLPTEWGLTARPVFSTDERRVYRLLREALPHHIVLSKLPLVRFCQPNDPAEVQYWYELLGGNNVSFAICSANGRVLAAIDLDTERNNSRRILQIKQSVLGACRVRYLRCPVDNLPTVAELQLLVPSSNSPARGPQPTSTPSREVRAARQAASHSSAGRRGVRAPLWQDSFQDSFFAPDNRLEGLGNSEFAALTVARPLSAPVADPDPAPSDPSVESPGEGGGVVVDATKSFSASRH